jgi:hypothetical protein
MAPANGHSSPDVEANLDDHAFLENDTVQSFSWKGVSVSVKDSDKKRKTILSSASGSVKQGAQSFSHQRHVPVVEHRH